MDLGHIHDILSDWLSNPVMINRYSHEAIASAAALRDAIRKVYLEGVKDGKNNEPQDFIKQ